MATSAWLGFVLGCDRFLLSTLNAPAADWLVLTNLYLLLLLFGGSIWWHWCSAEFSLSLYYIIIYARLILFYLLVCIYLRDNKTKNYDFVHKLVLWRVKVNFLHMT